MSTEKKRLKQVEITASTEKSGSFNEINSEWRKESSVWATFIIILGLFFSYLLIKHKAPSQAPAIEAVTVR